MRVALGSDGSVGRGGHSYTVCHHARRTCSALDFVQGPGDPEMPRLGWELRSMVGDRVCLCLSLCLQTLKIPLCLSLQ